MKPPGRNTVTPRIVTPDVGGLVKFIKTVFEGRGELQTNIPSEIAIGDSYILISDGGGIRPAMPAFLYVYVDDADKTFDIGMSAGAANVEPPADMPWGDRRATIRDPWGNLWQIASVKSRG